MNASAPLAVVLATLLWAGLAAAASDFDLLDINEGELRFLTEPPATQPHLQSTHVQISEESLKTGWVRVKQCHYRLDRVKAMQVVFAKGRVRDLKILRADNIARVWVEQDSVQLEDIGEDAVLCILSENRSLKIDAPGGGYEWHGGPYMRRFLDGYFPMHLKLAVDYPAARLRLVAIEPPVVQLKAVSLPGHVHLDLLFEGRLEVSLHFAAAPASPGIGW
jgi:hypothetical protein